MNCKLDFARTCTHQNSVDDDVSGDVVCCDCGLVLDKIYFNHQSMHKTMPHSDFSLFNGKNIATNVEENFVQDLIDEMTSKCNIESTNIKQIVRKKWKKISFHLKKKDKKNSEKIILICIYNALIEANVPRPLSHLCVNTNMDYAEVKRFSKNNEDFYKPHLMCEYFLHVLDLKYSDIKEIKNLVKKYEALYVFSQKTLIAACAYIFLREKIKKNHMSVNSLAAILDTSAMAIYRCLKSIEK